MSSLNTKIRTTTIKYNKIKNVKTLKISLNNKRITSKNKNRFIKTR